MKEELAGLFTPIYYGGFGGNKNTQSPFNAPFTPEAVHQQTTITTKELG